jgi:hypothetical protein
MSATEVELNPFSQKSSIAATMIRLRVSIDLMDRSTGRPGQARRRAR